jgi:multidrug resistance efflux pump
MISIRRHIRKILWAVLVILAFTAAGSQWLLLSRAGNQPPALPPTATGESAGPRAVCFGHVDVEPGISSLYPVQPGRVQTVHVRDNEAVKAGTVLLSLDKRMAESLVQQAEADWQAAVAQSEQAEKLVPQQALKEAEQQAAIDALSHRLKAAELALSRKAGLVGIQVNEKEVEAARAQNNELEAALRGEQKKLDELRLNDPRLAIRRAKADVAAKKAKLDQANLALSECDFKAPTDGTVLRVLVNPGEILGMPARQPAIWFCPQLPRIIRAEVEQEFAGRVAVGQDAAIQDDTSAAVTWRGKVIRIADWYTHRRSILQEPLQLNDVRTLECIIALEPGQPPLRIGQRVRVVIGPGGTGR